MSASADKDRVVIPGGLTCRKCGKPMQRFEHSPAWRPLPGRNYFRFWDQCASCPNTQHYEAARVRVLGPAQCMPEVHANG